MSLETYDRELERYGGPETTAVCEEMACVDSPAVRGLLGAPGLDRIEVGLVSMAALLDTLAVSDLRSMTGTPAAGGRRFREQKERLRALVHAGGSGRWDRLGPGWERVGSPLAHRQQRMRPLVHRLREAGGVLSDLAPSILHLHANRLDLDRAEERLALGLLDRTTRSLQAHRPDMSATPAHTHQQAEVPA